MRMINFVPFLFCALLAYKKTFTTLTEILVIYVTFLVTHVTNDFSLIQLFLLLGNGINILKITPDWIF